MPAPAAKAVTSLAMPTVAPYGSWPSPLGLDALVAGAVSVAFPMVSDGMTTWVEQRPQEQGRQVLVALPDGPERQPVELTGGGVGVRSLVHEYGGLAYTVHRGIVFYVDAADQRLYRLEPGGEALALTPEPDRPRSIRHGLPVVSPDGRWLLAVRERHGVDDGGSGSAVVNEVVAVPTDGSGAPRIVLGGHDFYGHLAVAPDGRRIAWVQWDHPDMPWDASELWEAEVADGWELGSARRVAGGPGESVSQPRYGPDGRLTFLSDRSGWWNLYRDDAGQVVAVAPIEAEVGEPDWALGTSTYAILDDGTIVATWIDRGLGRLGWLQPGSHQLVAEPTPFVRFSHLRAADDGRSVVAVAGSPTEPACVVAITPTAAAAGAGGGRGLAVEVVHRPARPGLPAEAISVAEPVDVPVAGGDVAHALFYPPRHPTTVGPPGERPPLIVRCHGGPTAAASPVYQDAVQFWTSRGVAVVDVDYGGSSGYGRRYRERLAGRWGLVDVEDCVAVARHLAASGRVDGNRMVVQGSSAGGYTVLCAATFTDAFAAGVSLYGIGDVAALARDTHKFEAHYLDRLVGPWPDAAAVYEQRSPLRHVDRLATPLILFQGLDDPVVPPNQAEAMAAALDARGVPHALVLYEGEQHGFRRAEHIRRTVEAQLSFLGQVLGFVPADELDPVEIRHADRLADRRSPAAAEPGAGRRGLEPGDGR